MPAAEDLQNILVVSNFFPPHTIGGAEIVAFRQASALKARGHNVTILAGCNPSESAPAGSLNLDFYRDLRVYRLSLRSLDPNLNFYWPAAARRLAALIAAGNIDVVHIHNAMGLGANLIPAVKAAGARCVVTLHDHWGFCFRTIRLRTDDRLCANHEECFACLDSIELPGGPALPMRLRRDYVAWCVGQADQLLTPSRYLGRAYHEAGFPAHQLAVISNGIDLDSVPCSPKIPAPDGVVRFLCSAYLAEHKGIPTLLEAAARLAQDPEITSRWRLTIAGEGHLRTQIEATIETHCMADRVRLLGRVPREELLASLRETDVMILASICPENQSVSMLEAIASGTAQIATRIGGTPELVEDSRSGFLVTPGDPLELAEAMRRYILEPELAQQHGCYNRERRNAFDERRSIVALEETLAARPKVAAAQREPVILCGSAWPPQQVAALVNRLHEHLLPGPTPRLIWHDFADAAVWKDVRLLWLWDRHPAQGLVSAALRRGVPVLAPDTGWAQGLARHFGAVIPYRSYLEALAALRAWMTLPSLQEVFRPPAHAAAASATALAPRASFGLFAQTPN